MNARLAACGGALAIVAIAPWPAGAAPPLRHAELELVAAVVLALLAWSAGSWVRPAPRHVRLLGAAAALFVGLGALQTLPLGGALPLVSASSDALRAARLPDGVAFARTISLDPHETRVAVMRLAAACAIALTCARAIHTTRGAYVAAGVLALTAALQATYGVGLALTGGTNVVGRVRGSYVSPNHFAALLALAIPIALALARAGSPRAPRARALPWWLTIGVASIALVLSSSRTGIAGALAGIVTYYAVLARPGERRLPPGLLVLGTSLLALGGLVGLGRVVSRFGAILAGEQTGRVEFIRVALGIWSDFPLFGAGLRSHPQLTPARLVNPKLLDATHNDFVNVLADAGAVGFLLLIIALVCLAREVAAARRALPLGRRRALLAGCSGAVVAQLVACQGEFSLQIPANLWACSAAAGLALGARTFDRPAPVDGAPPRLTRALALALCGASGVLGWAAATQWRAEFALQRGLVADGPGRLTLLAQAERLDPDYAQPPLHASRALLDAGRIEEAIAAAQRACAREPLNAVHHNHLARALLAGGELERCATELRHASELAPHFPDLRIHTGKLWIALARRRAGRADLERALTCFRVVLRWRPAAASELLEHLLLLPIGPRAIASLIPPERETEARRAVADALIARDRLGLALEALHPLLGQGSAEDDHRGGALYCLLQLPDEALASFRAAVAAAPAASRHHYLRAGVDHLLRISARAQALTLAREISSQPNQDPALLAAAGVAFLRCQRLDEAVRALERARSNGFELAGQELGAAYLALGRKHAALAAWMRVLPFVFDTRRAVTLRVAIANRLLEEERQRARAIALLREASQLDPTHAGCRAALERLGAQ